MAVTQQPRLFLYPADLLCIYDHITHYQTALKKYNRIKNMLGKQKHQKLTVKEFADWEMIPEQEIINRIPK
jgi:hypothetical protein